MYQHRLFHLPTYSLFSSFTEKKQRWKIKQKNKASKHFLSTLSFIVVGVVNMYVCMYVCSGV